MKKVLVALVLVLLFAVQATPALADDGSVTTPATTASTATDPDIAAVKEKMQTIIQMRSQDKVLNQELTQQTQTNKGLLEGLKNGSMQSNIEAIKQVRASNQTLEAQIQPTLDQIKSLKTQLQSATDANTKAQLRTQIQALAAQVAPVRQQIKSNLDGVKSDIAVVKAAQQARKTAMQPVKDLWTAQHSLWDQVKNLEQQKQALWTTASQQREAKDYTGLSGTLDQIIALKTQIQDIKGQILLNKQQVTQALQGIASTSTTTPDTSSTSTDSINS